VHRFIDKTHSEWQEMLENAINCVDKTYLMQLEKENNWLPGINKLFAAFSQPLSKTQYLLLGESPYPRSQSANGYAFWDNSVQGLWSEKGLSREVNKATSLRNFIKMLLVARGDLHENLSQEAIAALDKSPYWQTAPEFFSSLMDRGFLLLNYSLVFSKGQVPYHAKKWQPFMSSLFKQLKQIENPMTLILFGRIAAQIQQADNFSCIVAEHPYNLSFINNKTVLNFFKPLDLLSCHDQSHNC